MTTKHTPGPWTIERSGVKYEGHVIIAKATSGEYELRDLARTACEDAEVITPEDDANASLIASAPDLLAALEALTAKLERNPAVAWMSDPDWQRASAAIAKANGE